MDKRADIGPDPPRLDKRNRSFATWRPDTAQVRKQAKSRLVLAPDFDRGLGVGGLDFGDGGTQFFSTRPAARVWQPGDDAVGGLAG